MNTLDFSSLKTRIAPSTCFILDSLMKPIHFEDVQWRLEDSGKLDIVFYQQRNTFEEDGKLLKERLQKAEFRFIFIGVSTEEVSPDFLDQLPKDLPASILPETTFFELQKNILDQLYPIDFEQKKIIGITGTNGKSTTVDWCSQIAESAGKRAFSIGTLGVRSKGKLIQDLGGMTTPPYIELRKVLHKHFQNHDVCFMEVSSHALIQKRVYDIPFHAVGWTSFSQDHLDYHGSMEAYFEAKTLILNKAPCFVPQKETTLLKRFEATKFWPLIHKTKPLKDMDLKAPLFLRSEFNQNNLELAYAINAFLWGKLSHWKTQDLRPLPGRFNCHVIKGRTFVIDYAHTPDALENIAKSIRRDLPHNRFLIVFGCGGDRDKTKRPLMGRIATEIADFVYVTSDNPRTEVPEKILDDITAGITSQNFVSIVNRKQAIEAACSEMGDGDVLLVAGKGHEEYQIIGTVKKPFSDLEVLTKAME